MDNSKTIGFAGVGRMGSRMARNLANGDWSVVLYNRTTERAQSLADEIGAEVAVSARDLAARSDVIITMLADGDVLLETYESEDGLLAGLSRGALAIDMGTSGPDAFSRTRSLVERAGGRMIDAPVSGSTSAAEGASLLIMVGGDRSEYSQAEPLLSRMGYPRHVGPVGSASTLKLAVNSILYGINQAFAEAVLLAESAGIDPATVLDVVANSAAGAPMVGYRRAQYLDPNNAPITFTLDLAAKDLGLALAQAESNGVAMQQLEKTQDLLWDLIAEGYGDRDLGFVLEGARRSSSRDTAAG